jgi:hypothetical protein
VNGPPERESRPAANWAADVSAGNLDAASMPAGAPCCGQLGWPEIVECSRRGIYCSADRCAYRALLDRQLERHADHEWRLAELTVAADYFGARGHFFGAWVAAQLRDLRDLLSSGETR